MRCFQFGVVKIRKLLVATRTSVLLQKQSQILECMKHYPEGVTPKIIALDTRINVNTVKSILPKLSGIKKILRGLYKVVEGGDGGVPKPSDVLSDWNFHNVVLSCQLVSFPERLIQSTYSFGLVNVEFVISCSGNASLRVGADNPLNVSSICLVFGLFLELLGKFSDDDVLMKAVFVRTIEFNKDYCNLRLDGVRCITVDSLMEQFKVYQKKIGMRVEHKTKVKFSVENVVDMLSSNPNNLETNVRLSEQGKLLKKLSVATSVNTRSLYKLIDKLKEE